MSKPKSSPKPKTEKTYYVVYQTTNLVNGHIYVGVHRTNDLDDDYLGSGKKIKKAIETHGVENFKRDLLFIFDSEEEMFAKEAEIVNREFINRRDTYNVALGGVSKFVHPEYVKPKRYKRYKSPYRRKKTSRTST